MIVDVIHFICAPAVSLHDAGGRRSICNKLGDFTMKKNILQHLPGGSAMQSDAHAVWALAYYRCDLTILLYNMTKLSLQNKLKFLFISPNIE